MPWIAMGLALAVLLARGTGEKKKKKGASGNYSAEGMCLGMCFGSAIGTSLGISTGICLGMLIGLTIGSCIKKEPEEKDKDEA